MRYALISDIHSNLIALNEAIKEIKKYKVEKVLVAGDICGKGPQPIEVIEKIKNKGFIAVKGNADIKFLSYYLRKKKVTQKDKPLLQYIHQLPVLNLLDENILLCHGSPLKITDYVYPSITEEGLKRKLNGFQNVKVLCCGHSHIPFVKKIKDVMIVNGGSVGRPIDGDPRGSFAIFEINQDHMEGEIVRFKYDIDSYVEILRKNDYPEKTILSYLEGTKVD